MKKHRIALVGAGQIGSRHLQGLIKSVLPLDITVFDPSTQSLAQARIRMQEVPQGNPDTAVVFSQAVGASDFDLAVIATHSGNRLAALRALLEKSEVRHIILEKLLFNREADYMEAEKLLGGRKTAVWVNCPRRIYPYYASLKSTLKTPVFMQVHGGGWGLACNAIHHIDLFAFLAGSSSYRIELQLFREGVFPAKRQGCIEIAGTCSCDFGSAGRLTLVCHKETLPVTIILQDGAARFVVDEAGQKIWQGKETQAISIPFQSDLTTSVAESLLQTGTCGLASYKESMAQHLPFIRMLENTLRIAGVPVENGLPVT